MDNRQTFQPRTFPVDSAFTLREFLPGKWSIHSAVTGLYLDAFDRETLDAIGRALALADVADLPLFANGNGHKSTEHVKIGAD